MQIIWKLAPVKWDGLDKDSEKFSWWWKKVCTISLNKVNQDRIQLSGYIVWMLWKTRNLWIFKREMRTEKEAVDLAVAEW